ncbi:MAG: hypothetical protein GX930_08645 [Clostridia bacterium]|jgi:hypothetical protein|nr:hypothetical protein [Clostridia bacterium]
MAVMLKENKKISQKALKTRLGKRILSAAENEKKKFAYNMYMLFHDYDLYNHTGK